MVKTAVVLAGVAMDSAEMMRILVLAAAANTLAVVIVLVLRRPLRGLAGARVAYQLWWLPVLVTLIALLPLPPLQMPIQESVLLQMLRTGAATSPVQMPDHPAGARVSWAFVMMLAWALGTTACIAGYTVQQQRHARSLGPLVRDCAGYWRARTDEGLPAVVGLFPARIVLPVDFEQMFDQRQQQLVLLHEHVHLRRGDPFANLTAMLLRSTHWFNPLMPIAMAAFRQDQELACDAVVLAMRPADRRAYADALLLHQFTSIASPLASHWLGTHPLTERIQMLHVSPHSRATRCGASLFLLGVLAGTSWLTWAAQAPAQTDAKAAAHQPLIDIRMTMQADGQPVSSPRVVVKQGGPFSMRVGKDAASPADDMYGIAGTARQHADGKIQMVLRVNVGGRQFAEQRLLLDDGKPTEVRIPEAPALLLQVDASAAPARHADVQISQRK